MCGGRPFFIVTEQRKSNFDAIGIGAMVGFTLLMAINQVSIKFVNDGLQPVFQAGLRSFFAAILITAFVLIAGRRFNLPRAAILPALFVGFLFAIEFLFLYISLDLTTVSRTTLLFYTMPIWMAVLAHFFIPGESLSPIRWLGLGVAVAGVVIVIGERLFTETAETGLGWLGDVLCLLGAFGWALLALTIRITPFGEANNQTQLVCQLAVSAVILLPISLLFGPLVREFTPIMGGVVAFQVIVVVCFGFTAWLWIVRHYPATKMASFIFLTPVFGAGLGVFLLGEALNGRVIAALLCVSLGIVLINRK